MPKTTKPPAYRLYKRTGQAVVSLDGPDDDVLKIKPPMPFTESHADSLLSVFDRSLQQLETRIQY